MQKKPRLYCTWEVTGFDGATLFALWSYLLFGEEACDIMFKMLKV